jgi:hypothetical protein
MDNKPQIDTWDAIWPIAVLVASVVLAIVSMGTSSALSASVAAGGTAGASTTMVATVASVLVGAGVKASTALYVTTSALAATNAVVTSVGVSVAVKEALLDDITINGDWMKVSRGGIYAGYAWPFRDTTQTISVNGGVVIEPALLESECVNLYNTVNSRNLRLSCAGGDCFL